MDAPLYPKRRTPRLRRYDYASTGAYFVTICAHNRECILGTIEADCMVVSDIGNIAHRYWLEIPRHFPNVDLDDFIVMPNHLHGILIFQPTGAMNRAPTLGEVVRAFKARVSAAARKQFGQTGVSVWQRNYYEHVIRKDEDMNHIRQYIIDNPKNWATDRENPDFL
jgi:putative transposase